MYRLNGISQCYCSFNNQYASQYQTAFKQGVLTQQRLDAAKLNPKTSQAEKEKLEKDLRKWINQVEILTPQVKNEETQIAMRKEAQKEQGNKIDYMA